MLKRFVCLFLSVIMLTSVFAACTEKSPSGEDSDITAAIDDSESATDEIKSSPYVIVIPEGVSDSIRVAAISLQSKILKETGYALEVDTDYVSWSDTPNEYEILIGNVDREELELEADIRYNDYVVRTVNKKWMLIGGSETATLAAIAYFSDECIQQIFDPPAEFRYYLKGTNSVESFTLCGKDISEYTLVYPSSSPVCLSYAERIQNKIAELCGVKIPIHTEASAPKNGAYINIGETESSDCDLTTVGYDSYELAASNGSVSIVAGCYYGYDSAIKLFEEKLTAQKVLVISSDELNYEFDQVSRSEYIANPDLFIPVWRDRLSLEAPRSFDEKIAVFSDPNTTELFTMAHRGEHTYYPECSVEALISAYLMGADSIEIDIRYTADGVPIILHDATLTRVTNFAEMKGKTVNGITLPTTAEVSTWTYEQLMCLNLKQGSIVTEYKIASFEDMLLASKNRIFLFIDDKERRSDALDMAYEYMKKTGNYTSLLIGGTGEGMGKEKCVEIQKKIKKETGATALIYLRSGASTAASAYKYLNANAVGPYAIHLEGGYVREEKIKLKLMLDDYGDKLNFGIWTLDGSALEASPTLWQEIYDLGFRFIIVDKLVDLLKYKKQNNY